MLISFMSFLLKFKFQREFILGVRGEHQVMLTHSHNFKFFIPICEEVKKIYRDHLHHPKIPSYHIVILIYITQQYFMQNDNWLPRRGTLLLIWVVHLSFRHSPSLTSQTLPWPLQHILAVGSLALHLHLGHRPNNTIWRRGLHFRCIPPWPHHLI